MPSFIATLKRTPLLLHLSCGCILLIAVGVEVQAGGKAAIDELIEHLRLWACFGAIWGLAIAHARFGPTQFDAHGAAAICGAELAAMLAGMTYHLPPFLPDLAWAWFMWFTAFAACIAAVAGTVRNRPRRPATGQERTPPA